MAAETLITNISSLLKQDLLPVIQREVFTESPLITLLKNRGNAGYQKLQNNTFYIAVQTGQHSGVYAAAENAQLNRGKPTYAQMTISPKYIFGTHYLSHQAIKVAEGGADALANVVTEFGDTVRQAMTRDLNRQFYGYGEGILTLINGAATSATQTVDNTENLAPGMQVLIGTKAEIEAGTADTATISTINSATSITLDTSITTADNDRVVKIGVYTGSAYNEMMGLQGLVDKSGGYTTTFQGVTRSSSYWANSYVDDSSGALTIAGMTTAMLNCRMGKPDVALTNSTLYQKYASLLASEKRITNQLTLQEGFSGLEIAANGSPIPLVLDYQAPEGEMYFINTPSFVIGELAPMNWLDEGEGVLKWIPNYAAYEAILYYYAQLMCSKPKANAALRNKTA
jgi:hypothetical protein